MRHLNLSRLIHGKVQDPAVVAVVSSLIRALAAVEDDYIHKRLLRELVRKYVSLEKMVDRLLKNTLPEVVAEEIKYQGVFTPIKADCSVLFTDVAGFTKLATHLALDRLIAILDGIFAGCDGIVERHGGTKIKTIGDSYMAVFGVPEPLEQHAVQAVLTARALLDFIDQFNRETFGEQRDHYFQFRVGIHCGEVMAGVIGRERMQFDIFGDNVNIASRFESSGEPGRINVSEDVFHRTRDRFVFDARGEIPLKNHGCMRAYYVCGLR
ncbi:MAG: adenylate/guanylate cyclase domain-containing protein [Magnetococcus sp. DMHC-8]